MPNGESHGDTSASSQPSSYRLSFGGRRPAGPASSSFSPGYAAGLSRAWRTGACALAAGLFLLLGAQAAQAQTASKQVGNTSSTTGNITFIGNQDMAQAFTTGSSAAGYKLTRVDLRMKGGSGTAPTYNVTIRSDSSGSPGASPLGTLTNPSSWPATLGPARHDAPSAGITLAANTTYWVVFDITANPKASQADWRRGVTTSGDEDADPWAGWSIADTLQHRHFSSAGWTGYQAGALRLDIYATPLDNGGPLLSSATVSGKVLTLTFDEILDPTSTPPGSDFWVRAFPPDTDTYNVLEGAGTARIDGRTVEVTLDKAAMLGETLQVNHIRRSGGPRLRDAARNPVSRFVNRAATNDTIDPTPPTFSGGTVSGGGRTVTLNFAGPALRPCGNSDFPVGAFTVKVDGADAPVWRGRCEDHSVVFDLSRNAPSIGDARTVTVSYDRFKASFPNRPLASIYDVPVGNFKHWLDGREATPPTLSVARVEGLGLTVTFSEPLDAGSVPAGSAFTVSGGRTGTDMVEIRGTTARVWLDSAVADGEAVTVSYRAAEWAKPLRDAAGNPVANFSNAALHNATGPPSFVRASVSGETLVMTFDEPLDADEVPAPGAFHVTVGNSRRDVAAGGVAIRGADVVLTLASAVGRQTTFVRYTKLRFENQLRDLVGNAVETFADQYVHPHETSHAGARVSGVSVVSDPGADDTYGLNDTVRVRVAFNEAVHVAGSPRIAIDLDPGEGGTRHAAYASGSGTKALVFTYGVVEPDVSTQGIAVVANTLELNGGSIRSAPSIPTPGVGTGVGTGTGAAAGLSHDGLAHDPAHKVDWQQSPPEASAPSVTGVAVSSRPASGDTYGVGETIRVTVSFGEAVDVEGSPRLKIKMDPGYGEKWAAYESGGGASALVFAHTVVEPNHSPQGIAVVENSLEANGGTVRSADTEEDADLSHDGLAHDPAHKVDWRQGSGDTTPPRLVRGEIDGGTVTLWFSEALDPAATGGRFEMTVQVSETGSHGFRASGGVAIAGEVVTFGVGEGNPRAKAGLQGRNRVAYYRHAEPAAGELRDLAGNPVVAPHTPVGHGADAWRYVRIDLDNVTEPAPTAAAVTGVAVTSAAGADATYALGETIGVTVTFDGPVDVTGSPRLKIDMDPASWGEKWAAYSGGGGTASLTFAHRVVEPNYSPQGIAVLANTLELNGGAIRSAATGADADLSHDGLGHDAGHKVDWRPTISVADASATEGTNASVEFRVSLSRAFSTAGHSVTVAYATADGTAKAGEDYTAASGTLTFAAGESSKAVSVAVIDDAHDEGSETFTFTLSNAAGAHVGDGQATGTIENKDLMPAALLARFGRATAEQVVEQIEERMTAPRERGFTARLAGRELRPGSEGDFALGFVSQFAPMNAGADAPGGGGLIGAAGTATDPHRAGAAGADTSGLGGLTGLGGATGGHSLAGGARGGGLFGSLAAGGDLLSSSEFELNRASHGGMLSVWSRSSRSYFAGMEEALSLNGDVRTTMFGADWARGPLTLGLSVGHTRGLGGYTGPSAGAMTTSMTGFYPWVGYQLNDRVSVWAVSGYGKGSLSLTPEGAGELETGMSMAMTAVGTRGELLGARATGGFGLAFKADALWVGAATELLEGPAGRLNASEAGATRVRTALEGSRGFTLGGGRLSLRPTVEVGLRRDGGDAETGAGLDVGGGLAVTDAAMGLSLDVRVRTLLAHQAEGFAERGLSVSFGWDPAPSSPFGLSARLAPSWGGSAMGGAETLWNGQMGYGPGSSEAPGSGAQLDAEVGYGLPVGARFVGTPRVGLRRSEYGREYRAGWGFGVLDTSLLHFDLGLEAQRREDRMAGGADSGVLARATVSW